jgi:lipopolysaccharide export system permease protein
VSGQPVPVLIDGHEYKLSSDGEVDRISEFKKLTIYPKEVTLRYKHKSASTFDLAQSQDSEGIAEYQWRLSTPLSAILLALLGIPLSRATPRQGKYSKIFLAMIAFAIYHNLGAIAKTWVEQGVVPPIPGIWWVHGLLAIILLAIYRPYLSLTR